ncbi:MAG: FAD:protein FMN transferase [Candidatus Omnitrophica bacterium]|nr:FAD:protein FMN transferase [Candidatus Omnitrophota bacterium]
MLGNPLLGIVVLFFLMFGVSFADGNAKKVVEARPLFGTVVTMEACLSSGEEDLLRKAMDRAWECLEGIQVRMNVYSPSSEASRVNQANGKAIEVSTDLYDLISRSKEYQVLTGKAFDITISPLSRLWKESSKAQRYPSKEDVLRSKGFVGSEKIELLDGRKIRLPEGMAIDLGGNAPGFSTDEVVKILHQGGLKNFLIDVGGEIYASGVGCDGRKWRIGSSDPGGHGKFVDVLELQDMAVSTSGDQEKFFEIKGERLSHIINPLTGYPVRGAASVTVLAPTTMDADVLSTALCVLGPQAGLKLLSSLGKGYEAMMLWRRDDGSFERYASDGYDSFRLVK